MKMFRGLNATGSIVEGKKNYLLIFGEGEDGVEVLDIQAYKNATDALASLFELENKYPGKDIVLVGGDRPDDIRESFKNYFSDAMYFVDLIDEGCEKLVPKRWMKFSNK